MDRATRILVVDDDPDVLAGTARVLAKAGYTTAQAASGEDALQALPGFRPDLVLLDRDLPGLDGVEVCRRIKDEHDAAAVFVVLISGTYTDSDQQAEGLEAGADGYIARPIGNRELLARVDAYLRILQLTRSLDSERRKLLDVTGALPGLYLSVIDADYTVAMSSGGEFARRGLDPAQFNGQNLEQVFGEQADAVRAQYAQAFAGNPVSFDLEIAGEAQHYTATPLTGADGEVRQILAVVEDVSERRDREALVAARLRLLEATEGADTLDELLRAAVDTAEGLTRSSIGFFHFLAEDQQTLSLQMWSRRTVENMCTADGQGTHYPVDQAGVWADAVRQGRPVIHNDYAGLPNRKGLPPGHAPVEREMVVPVRRGEQIVAVLGVGNKAAEYNYSDARNLAEFADMVWDLVARRRAEQDRQAGEARYRALFDGTPNPIAIYDRSARFLLINQAGADNLGRPAELILGRALGDFMPGMQAVTEERIARVLEVGRSLQFEDTIELAAGARTFFSVFQPLPGLFRGQQAVQVVSHDVTERRAAEAEQERQRYYLQKSQEMGHIGTWELDLVTERLYWTEETYRIFGVAQGTAVAFESFLGRVHPEDEPAVRSAWAAALGGQPYDLEHRIVMDGVTKWVHEKAHLEFDDQGTPLRALGFTQDISADKLSEQARLQLEDQLRQTQKLEAIGTLAGGIAHDFNNMLGAILGFSEMLKGRMAPGSEDEEDIGEVLAAARRARELVKQILTFSRRSAESRQPVQMHLVVGEALRLLRQTIPATIEIRPDISKVRDTVLADATQVHQIIMNLVTNAYQSLEEAHGTLSVALRAVDADPELCATVPGLTPGPYVRLSVTDTGAGMDPQTLNRIFEPFFTTKPVGKGTGMGMAVVHGIVTGHGGAIRIDSQLGRGTRVDVYLPYHSSEEPAASQGQEFAAPPRGHERVLVVDDEAALARVVSKTLERLGYRAVTAASGAEALERFTSAPEPFDLVVTDQAMPGMSGAQLTGKLLELHPGLPVILCTGYSATLDAARAREIGAKALLAKPLEKELLARVVREVLDGER